MQNQEVKIPVPQSVLQEVVTYLDGRPHSESRDMIDKLLNVSNEFTKELQENQMAEFKANIIAENEAAKLKKED